jgi:glycogen debranching enzyme
VKSPSFVLKEDRWFACFDDDGAIRQRREGLAGIYTRDLRLLDRWEYAFSGIDLSAVYSDDTLSHRLEQRFINPSFVSAHSPGAIELQVTRVMTRRGYVEKLRLLNHTEGPLRGELQIRFHLDLADLMEVRQMLRDGLDRRPGVEQKDARTVRFSYTGEKGFGVEGALQSDTPFRLEEETLVFPVELALDADVRLVVLVGARILPADPSPLALPDASRAEEEIEESVRLWRSQATRVETEDPEIDRLLQRSLDDLRLLFIEGEEPDSGFIAAGIPHFVALFGRDSLLVSFQLMMMRPDLARENLRALARLQGTRDVEVSEEEPGKILHEWRTGERSQPDVYPYTYATLDAGPLFLFLLGEYVDWTGDLGFAREMLPVVRRILEWCRTRGDLDGDGFLEYLDLKQGRLGLVHRGWKDGEPAAVTSADGSVPEFPIAMVEFQGYLHDGLVACARLFSRLGGEDEASTCRAEAERLRESFAPAFYWPEEEILALGLDGKKKRIECVSSNAGHCLLGDLVPAQMRQAIARRLLAPDLFSGFGIRTLSSKTRAYSPFRYQRGAVWPHDNAVCAWGLARHGFRKEASRVVAGILAAAKQLPGYRLPELFSGLAPEETGGRVARIGIACAPQGWAAASPFLLLRAVLGIEPDALAGRLRLSPFLSGTGLGRIRVRDLAFAEGKVSFLARLEGDRTVVEELETTGGLEVEVATG